MLLRPPLFYFTIRQEKTRILFVAYSFFTPVFTVIFVFMPGVARPSFQSAGSYPAQTIMNAFL